MKIKSKRILLTLMLVCMNVSMLTMGVDAAGSSKLKAPVVTLSNVASSGKIKVSWKKINKAVSYSVYRSTDGKKWSRILTTKKNSMTNTGAIAGKTYYYKVRANASKSSNNSAYSKVKSRTCDLSRPSISLSNVEASGKVKVSWKKINKAVSYEVSRSRDGEEWKTIFATKDTSMVDSGAVAGKKYYYKVKAIATNENANSAFSAYKSRVCDLARPEITLSTVESSGKTKISWKKVEGATSYRVYNSRNKEDWKRISTTDELSVVNTSATAGKKYYYKVRAICSNSSAYSAYSPIKYRTCKYPQKDSDDNEDNVQSGELSKYQKEVVALAKDIEANWKTNYDNGKTGQQNSKGEYMFDCSGFVSYVLNSVMEKYVPTYRITANLRKQAFEVNDIYNGGYKGELKAKDISKSNLQPGDIVFFYLNNANNDHCGIYIGDGKFIHCAGNADSVIVSKLSEKYYTTHYSKARRFLPKEVTPANTTKTVSGCSIYSKRDKSSANLMNKIGSLKSGAKVTVLYTGNSPASYNCAYIKTSNGTKGFIYKKNIR